jgi:hypothetical protein
MKSTKRALRRHHRQRMIRRALRSCRLPRIYLPGWDENEEGRRQRALRWCDNLQVCSCWTCGNPRKYYGRLTRQEQRFHQAADDEAAGT